MSEEEAAAPVKVKVPSALIFLCLVLVILGAVQIAILYRYLGARDRVISDAEKTVMRARLDQEGPPDGT